MKIIFNELSNFQYGSPSLSKDLKTTAPNKTSTNHKNNNNFHLEAIKYQLSFFPSTSRMMEAWKLRVRTYPTRCAIIWEWGVRPSLIPNCYSRTGSNTVIKEEAPLQLNSASCSAIFELKVQGKLIYVLGFSVPAVMFWWIKFLPMPVTSYKKYYYRFYNLNFHY